jgi:hypothetical protein
MLHKMLRLTFGTTDVHVKTTSTLTRLLASTHRRHCAPSARITDKSRFRSHSVSVHLAPPECSPELALRDAQREIAGEVAAVHGWLALEAVVVERDGRALALIGEPGAGKSIVAAHLLARRWKLVTDDSAFVDEARGTIVGHHGLMRFRSGAIPHLPAAFRATLERSKWFVGEDGELQFYEVDPETVFGPGIWSHEAVLDSAIFLADRPGSHAVEGLDGASSVHNAFRVLRTGSIGRDRAVRVADRVEHWYDAHARA